VVLPVLFRGFLASFASLADAIDAVGWVSVHVACVQSDTDTVAKNNVVVVDERYSVLIYFREAR